MSAKNVYHDAVVDALVADGWTITDDPLSLKVGDRDLYVDLGAERSPIAAERAGEKIAVEVQSCRSPSACSTSRYRRRCTMGFCPSRSVEMP